MLFVRLYIQTWVMLHVLSAIEKKENMAKKIKQIKKNSQKNLIGYVKMLDVMYEKVNTLNY